MLQLKASQGELIVPKWAVTWSARPSPFRSAKTTSSSRKSPGSASSAQRVLSASVWGPIQTGKQLKAGWKRPADVGNCSNTDTSLTPAPLVARIVLYVAMST